MLFLEPLRGVYDTYSYYSSACVATARLNMLDCLVFFLFLFEVQVLRVRVRRLSCIATPHRKAIAMEGFFTVLCSKPVH